MMVRFFRYLLAAVGTVFYWEGYAEQPDSLPPRTLYYIGTFGSVASNGLTPFGIVNGRYGKVPLKANNGYLCTAVYHRQQIGRNFRWDAGMQWIASTSRYRNV